MNIATIYFANGNLFNPQKRNGSSISHFWGKLLSVQENRGNNALGRWLIFKFREKKWDIRFYFESDLNPDSFDKYLNNNVLLWSENGSPCLRYQNAYTPDEIRSMLIQAVVFGHIPYEDMPAIFEFYQGNDELFEKWQIFKDKYKTKEELDEVKKENEEIKQQVDEIRQSLSVQKENLNSLKRSEREINQLKEEQFRRIMTSLLLLQGEEYVVGESNRSMMYPPTENLIRIGGGYNRLIDAFERLRPQKGVYVIADSKIHKIHSAYVEEKGRAFLLGSSQEFLKTKPERVKQIVDEVAEAMYYRTKVIEQSCSEEATEQSRDDEMPKLENDE